MSEDSIAWGRAEAGVPLPPRKRLLAGFKQNGWSPSSSPSYAGPLQDTHTNVSLSAGSNDRLDGSMDEGYRKGNADINSPVKLEDGPDSASLARVEEQGEYILNAGSIANFDSSLDSSSMVKLEEHDDGSVEHSNSEYVSFAADSTDLYHFRQRESKCVRGLPVVVTKETKKKAVSVDDFRKRKFKRLRALPVVVTKKMKNNVSVSVSAEKTLHAEGFSITDTDKEVDVSAVVGDVSVDTNVIAMAPSDLEERNAMAAVKAKEVKTGCTIPTAVRTIEEEAGKDAIVACAGDLKPVLSTCCKSEDDESVCCEVSKPTWNHWSKLNEGDGKPRRNQNRQHHDGIKERMREVQAERGSLTPLPLSDEELARQLHRIMNSSPRISRRLSYNENGPLLSPKRK